MVGDGTVRGVTLTGLGVWSPELRHGDAGDIAVAAAELEQLGYTALWIPDIGGPVFEALDRLLVATTTATIATGILNIWHHTPAETGEWFGALRAEQQRRVLLGIGVSHAPLIGDTWGRPLQVMNDYLDGLDAAGVPPAQRCIAALAPKMLALSRDRSAGAHPYNVPPEHTAFARPILGVAGLYVEQAVVLETDPVRARELARGSLSFYTGLPNYTNNWKGLGFTEDDIASLSDRLVDAIIVWGDVDTIGERIQAHRDAGADHVCIQVVGERGGPMPMDAWRALAPR